MTVIFVLAFGLCLYSFTRAVGADGRVGDVVELALAFTIMLLAVEW